MAEQRLKELIPDAENALALEPEELAAIVLQWLNTTGNNLKKLDDYIGQVIKDYEPRYRDRLEQAVMEACAWLSREGMIVHHPTKFGTIFISRRGEKLKNATDITAFRNAGLLPRAILHPVIDQKIYGTFVRGDYDMAVLQALREVEIHVRTAGGFAAKDIGVKLMRDAFDLKSGPLTNRSVIAGEQQGESDLFAGAMATYRNSIGHRHVVVTAETAVEMILLASHLMKIVDSRVPPVTSPVP